MAGPTPPRAAQPLNSDAMLSASSRHAKSSAIRDLLVHAKRPGVISLAGGLPAADRFPTERLASKAASIVSDPRVLQYGLTEGEIDLREWVAAHHSRLGDPSYTADDVQIVSGSQQGLDLIARVLLDPGDVVVVSDPEYLGAIGAFRQRQAELVTLPVDADGVDVSVLEDGLRGGLRPKCVYLIPEFHNPTGTTMSVERLTRLARLSDEYGFLVIEDNPYGQLRFEGHPVPSLASLTTNVVQCRTISKTIAPGLRVAWMVGPPWLLDAVRIAKQSADLHTSTVTQRMALSIMGDEDWYAAHIASLVPHYRARRDALSDALSQMLPEARFNRPSGGMFLWVELGDGPDTTELLSSALDEGVAFVPGAAFAVSEVADRAMRLSYSTATPEILAEGVSRLSNAIEKLVR